MRISDWSSDVCSSDLVRADDEHVARQLRIPARDFRCHRLARPQRAGELRRMHADHQLDVVASGEVPDRREPPVEHSGNGEIGRASCRDRECQSVEISVAAVILTKKNKKYKKKI